MNELFKAVAIVVVAPFAIVFYFAAIISFSKWCCIFFGLMP